ncbi:hypothetical protein ACWCP6_09815 [Streptomyces sp. NPDC002004]
MKSLKAAAAVVGSMVVVGGAAPAFASGMPTSLNGALETLGSQRTLDVQPLHTDAIDTEKQGSVVHSLREATDGLGAGGSTPARLLGGLPLAHGS